MNQVATAGLETIEAGDGEQALAQAGRHEPDLIVLDINMPKMDGLEVCRRLRAAGDVPILFLSSRDDEIDRVLGIELGGDDYVVKPFSPREVVARAMAILRRTSARTPPAAPAALRHGGLSLDTEGWIARWRGGEVALTVTATPLHRDGRRKGMDGTAAAISVIPGLSVLPGRSGAAATCA